MLWCSFRGDPQDFSALSRRQRFTIGDKAEEAAHRGQSAVPCSDRCLPFLFDVLQECQDVVCGQLCEVELRNGLLFLSRYEPEKQSPTITVRQHSVMRDVALLHQPVVEKGT
jgi:hypothetical protein